MNVISIFKYALIGDLAGTSLFLGSRNKGKRRKKRRKKRSRKKQKKKRQKEHSLDLSV